MNTQTAKLIFAFVMAGLMSLTSGCMLSQAATRLEVQKEGFSVKYSSPKDQHVEYDPATGRIFVKSTSNEALVNAAGLAQAEAMNKAAGVLQALVEKVD